VSKCLKYQGNEVDKSFKSLSLEVTKSLKSPAIEVFRYSSGDLRLQYQSVRNRACENRSLEVFLRGRDYI